MINNVLALTNEAKIEKLQKQVGEIEETLLILMQGLDLLLDKLGAKISWPTDVTSSDQKTKMD